MTAMTRERPVGLVLRRATRRAVQAMFVLLCVAVATFGLLRALPGDPAEIKVGPLPGFSPVQRAQFVEQVREQMGLNRAHPVQFAIWGAGVVRGDLGLTVDGQPVSQVISQRILSSVQLVAASIAFSVAASLLLALYATRSRFRIVPQAAESLATLVLVMPAFWIAFLLVALFAVRWRILPPSGYVPFSENPLEYLRRLALPCLTLSVGQIAVYFRYLYAGLQEARSSPFVTAARSKGISDRAVLYRHILPNALLPFVTVVGMFLGFLIGGTVIVEQVFGWPGLGHLLVLSVNRQDVNTLVAIVLITAIAYVTTSVVVDLTYTLLDPRTRRQ
jgi:peptide/nickel transport system permease protein